LLRYRHLARFDQDMIALAKDRKVPAGQELFLLQLDESAKVLAFMRGDLVFVFNFHPHQSFTDHRIPASPGGYRIVLDTDRGKYGGLERQDLGIVHRTITDRIHRHFLSLYLPARTAMVMAPVSEEAAS
jgi:1,4-alpha-glucan branching enzyme